MAQQCPNCHQYKMVTYKTVGIIFSVVLLAISAVLWLSQTASGYSSPIDIIFFSVAVLCFLISFFVKGSYCSHCRYKNVPNQ